MNKFLIEAEYDRRLNLMLDRLQLLRDQRDEAERCSDEMVLARAIKELEDFEEEFNRWNGM